MGHNIQLLQLNRDFSQVTQAIRGGEPLTEMKHSSSLIYGHIIRAGHVRLFPFPLNRTLSPTSGRTSEMIVFFQISPLQQEVLAGRSSANSGFSSHHTNTAKKLLFHPVRFMELLPNFIYLFFLNIL